VRRWGVGVGGHRARREGQQATLRCPKAPPPAPVGATLSPAGAEAYRYRKLADGSVANAAIKMTDILRQILFTLPDFADRISLDRGLRAGSILETR
jgi:hypothetical protein